MHRFVQFIHSCSLSHSPTIKAPGNNIASCTIGKAASLSEFESVLKQYEPMISAVIRQLHIYRDFESFRQAGRVALWQAWIRFDKNKGSFTPFAYRSIRGAMLDEMKQENRFADKVVPLENPDDMQNLIESDPLLQGADFLEEAVHQLHMEERKLLYWLFVEQLTQAECANRIGITVSGVKKRRERLLGKLRRQIDRLDL